MMVQSAPDHHDHNHNHEPQSSNNVNHSTLEINEEEAEEYLLTHIRESNAFSYIWQSLKSCILNGIAIIFRRSNRPSPPVCINCSSETYGNRHFMLILRLKILLSCEKPLLFINRASAWYWNVMYANNGLLKTLYRSVFNRAQLRVPQAGDSDFLSHSGMMEFRSGISTGFEDELIKSGRTIDLALMASKLVYENENVIKKEVEEEWKMHFVGFFNCWNEYTKSNSTQAFILTDKKEDAKRIMIAFRGTEMFDVDDWLTDMDISFLRLPGLGRVHAGFLEALGLGSRLNKESLQQFKSNLHKSKHGHGHSAIADAILSGLTSIFQQNDKILAYDTIRKQIHTLLKEHPGAEWYIAGHSMGGGLAVIFIGLLLYEDNKALLEKFGGVFTFGQPRTGDADFCNFMETKLQKEQRIRVVHRTDLVTRLPGDDPVFKFRHISPCHFYRNRTNLQVVDVEPYNNIFSAMMQPMPHIDAIKELIQSLGQWVSGRSRETTLARLVRVAAVIAPGIVGHFLIYYTDALRITPDNINSNQQS